MEEGKRQIPASDQQGPPANPPPAACAGAGAVPSIPFKQRALSLMHIAAFAFLTYTSGLAAYRARSDPWTLAFVISAYGTLMLFFWCLRAIETAKQEKKERLRLVIWLLSMALNTMFSYQVASMVPFGFAVAIWTIAGVTTVAGFYAFFAWGGEKNSDVKGFA